MCRFASQKRNTQKIFLDLGASYEHIHLEKFSDQYIPYMCIFCYIIIQWKALQNLTLMKIQEKQWHTRIQRRDLSLWEIQVSIVSMHYAIIICKALCKMSVFYFILAVSYRGHPFYQQHITFDYSLLLETPFPSRPPALLPPSPSTPQSLLPAC